jgi:hypothetical protein
MNDTYMFQYVGAFDQDAAEIAAPIQTSVSKTIVVDRGTSWHSVMEQFANFMSDIYGYDINSKIDYN